MSTRDVSPDAYRKRDSRKGDHYSPAKKYLGANEQSMRYPERDITAYSMESLDRKPRGDGRSLNVARRTETQGRPDPIPTNAPEMAERPDPALGDASETQSGPDPALEMQNKADPAASVPRMIPEHIRRSVVVLNDYIRRKDREPLIGLEYILEYKVQVRADKIETKYFCEICEMDTGVVPMLDHLCGFKHRKLYVRKEYPYVLKALFSTKEDRAVFMRRIAMEIEKEEGTKRYKTDPLLRMVPVMNVKSTEAKQSKRKTRWDSEGDRQRKMDQALCYLDLYNIGNEEEATAAEKLLEKLTASMKFHTDKLKEEALFPAKVARARDVAMSLMRNAVMAWIKPVFLDQRTPVHKVPPLFNEGTENVNLGRPSDIPHWTPNAAFPQRPHGSPFNQKHDYEMAENICNDQTANSNLEPEIDPTDEDIEFFNKFMALLAVLPDDSPADESQMDSDLQMLKSLLDQVENTPTNQLMQFASLNPDRASMENQQLTRMVANKPPDMGQFGPNVMMQMSKNAGPAEYADQNPLMQMAARLKMQRNADLFLPENRNIKKRDSLEMGNNSSVMPMDQIPYRHPHTEGQPGFASTSRISRSDDGFGYDGRIANILVGNKKSRFDEPAKPTGLSNEPTRDLYARRSFDLVNKERDESFYSNKRANREYEDFADERTSYRRVSLSPSDQRSEEERFRDDRYHHNVKRNSRFDDTRPDYGRRRSFDDPAREERERDSYYGKRAKLDSDRMTLHSTERGRRDPDSGSRGPHL